MLDQLQRPAPVHDDEEDIILEIEDIIPRRKKVKLAGVAYEMKSGEEFDLEEVVSVMRFARTLALLQRMDALTSSERGRITTAVDECIAMGFPDMDGETISSLPFSFKLGLAQVFVENFTGALNRVQRIYRPEQPTTDMETLAEQLEELTSES